MSQYAIILFYASCAAVVYAYALYPAVIWTLARLPGSASRKAVDPVLPSVSILIAAHNEEAVIEQRIRNALALDYPRELLEIVIASDGSSDATATIARRHESNGVRLIDGVRQGKASVLNAAIPTLRGQIVLLSDANTFIEPPAVRRLVRWFADPTIGVVCGRLVLTDAASGENVDGVYWKYETFLKKQEGRLGALLGSNGAIYAIRRSLFQPVPSNTIIDDFVIPLLAKLRSGCRIIYDSEAIAVEDSAPDLSVEFRRRSRIGAGGWQAIVLLWPLLNPARGWVAFTFFSHKILRWLCPFFLVLAFAANVALLGRPVYRVWMAAQVAFYLAALAGRYVPKGLPLSKWLRLAHMFASMNAALLVGFFRWLSGPQTGVWRPTRRAA